MEGSRTPTKGEQGRIDTCEKVVNWANEDKERRGCIILAADEESATCAVIGCNKKLIPALASAIRSTPSLRDILSAALMLNMIVGGSKSDTDKD